jgi:hypothetical protein
MLTMEKPGLFTIDQPFVQQIEVASVRIYTAAEQHPQAVADLIMNIGNVAWQQIRKASVVANAALHGAVHISTF